MVERDTLLVPTLAALRNILALAGEGIPDYVVEKAHRCAEAHERSVRMFHEAGGRIALGTDAGTPFNLHGSNSDELRFMVEVGLSNLDALRAGTRNAADLMRLDDRGRITEGAAGGPPGRRWRPVGGHRGPRRIGNAIARWSRTGSPLNGRSGPPRWRRAFAGPRDGSGARAAARPDS